MGFGVDDINTALKQTRNNYEGIVCVAFCAWMLGYLIWIHCMYECVCMCVCMRVCMRVCMCVFVRMHVGVSVRVLAYSCVFARVWVRVHVCEWAHVCYHLDKHLLSVTCHYGDFRIAIAHQTTIVDVCTADDNHPVVYNHHWYMGEKFVTFFKSILLVRC